MATIYLPFLYPKRAAQRPLRAPAVRAFLRWLHDDARTPPTSPEPQSHRPAQRPPSPRRSPLQRDPIPFDLPPDLASELAREAEAAGDASQGTITPAERQAFRRIFGDMAKRERFERAVGEGEAAEAADTEENVEQVTAALGIRERVNTIVDQATADQIRAQQEEEQEQKRAHVRAMKQQQHLAGNWRPLSAEEQRKKVLASFPPSLREAARSALGIKDTLRQRPAAANDERADGGRQQQQQASVEGADGRMHLQPLAVAAAAARDERHARQVKMELLMLAQKSDFALWDYMEANVFSLVAELGLNAGRAAKTKTAESASTKLATTKSATTKLAPTKSAATKTARTRRNTSPSPPSPAHLATYGPLYPALLLHGLRLFDTHFHGGRTSPLALAVLPRIKGLGLASHVLGASTPLYNQLLRIHWTRRGDTAAVFALLAEMHSAGLAFDADTLDLVKSIEWHVLPLSRARPGLPGVPSMPVNDRAGGSAVLRAAVQTLPELAALSAEIGYWRAQVEKGIQLARR